MAFKMKGDPFKRVATKSMKNSAYLQSQNRWENKDKGPGDNDKTKEDAAADWKERAGERQGTDKKGGSDPFKQAGFIGERPREGNVASGFGEIWEDLAPVRKVVGDVINPSRIVKRKMKEVEEARNKQKEKEAGDSDKKPWKDPWKKKDAFKQIDDPWGIGGEKKRKDRRYNPSSSDLRSMIQQGALLLNRYKTEAEESGKMSDWKKYNEELAKFKDFDTYFSDYSNTLDDRTVRDSKALEEGDIAELEQYMDHSTKKHEMHSAPKFDKMMDFQTRLDEAKANNDPEAIKGIMDEFKKFKGVTDAMESGVSPEDYAKQMIHKKENTGAGWFSKAFGGGVKV